MCSCWLCSVLVPSPVEWWQLLEGTEEFEEAAASAADSDRMTQIRSPETMPQDDKVWSVSDRSSEPFRDKLNSVSALRDKNKRVISDVISLLHNFQRYVVKWLRFIFHLQDTI